jgi:hypothetical protein
LEVSVFNKGDRVKLNEYGLDSLFPSVASKGLRDMAAKAVFVVLGHIQHNRFTRVMVEGGSSNTAFSYSPTFLQAAEGGKLRKGQVITIYEEPADRDKTRRQGAVNIAYRPVGTRRHGEMVGPISG